MEEKLTNIKIIKIPGMNKIKWRYRKNERVHSTRWNRKYNEQAEHYWFWEIICKNHHMYSPLEEQFDLKSSLRMIPVPKLELRLPKSS